MWCLSWVLSTSRVLRLRTGEVCCKRTRQYAEDCKTSIWVVRFWQSRNCLSKPLRDVFCLVVGLRVVLLRIKREVPAQHSECLHAPISDIYITNVGPNGLFDAHITYIIGREQKNHIHTQKKSPSCVLVTAGLQVPPTSSEYELSDFPLN